MKKGIERKTGGLRPGDFRLGFLRKDGTDNGIENEKNSQRKRKRIVKAISILACIVAFTTTYALILPAVTLERQPDCGQTEHIHTAACYTYLDEDGNVVDPGDARVLALLASEDTDAGLGESGDTVASSLRGGYPEDSESVTDAEPVAAPVDPTAENAGTDASDAHDTSEASDSRETSDAQDTPETSDKSDASGTSDTSDILNPSEASSDVDAMDDTTDDATLDGENADAAGKTGTADPAQGTVRRVLICGMEEHQHSVECYAKNTDDAASDASSESGFLASLFSGLFGHDHDKSDESDESGQSDSSVESTESGDPVDSDESAESVNSTGSVESGKSAGSGNSADSADSSGSTTKSVTVAGTTITAEYEEGILPDDVTMQAVTVPADAYVGAVADAVGKEDTEIKTFDITFLSNEQEIEPSGEVKITFQADYITPDTDPSVVHITDDGSADLLDTAVSDDEITLTTDSFSVYAISYTVDFHYEVNGKTYDFSIPGGGFVSLEHMVEVLGIASSDTNDESGSASSVENDGNKAEVASESATDSAGEVSDVSGENSDSDDTLDAEKADNAGSEDVAEKGGVTETGAYERTVKLNEAEVSEATKKFVANVERVEFSDPELVDVSKVEETTTVGAIKKTRSLEVEYSAELTEKQIAEINNSTVEAGDWALISVKPFTSEESLTVTMKNGEQLVVKVTDNRIDSFSTLVNGSEYVLYIDVNGQYYALDSEGNTVLVPNNDLDHLSSDYLWKFISQVQAHGNYACTWTNNGNYLDPYNFDKTNPVEPTSATWTPTATLVPVSGGGFYFRDLNRESKEERWIFFSTTYYRYRYLTDDYDSRTETHNLTAKAGDWSTSSAFLYPDVVTIYIHKQGTEYTITAQSNNEEYGHVRLQNSGQQTSASNKTVSVKTENNIEYNKTALNDLVVVPEEGYEFTGWTVVRSTSYDDKDVINWGVDSTGTSKAIKPTVSGNLTLQANFKPEKLYTLTVKSNDSEMGTVSGKDVDGNSKDEQGEFITTSGVVIDNKGLNAYEIKANTLPLHKFVEWQLTDSEGNVQTITTETIPAKSIVLTDDSMTLIAVFRKKADTEIDETDIDPLLNSWKKDMTSDFVGVDKTAHVTDYENRIYEIDLSASSGKYAVDQSITLDFITDTSRSMYFPANLDYAINDKSTEKENKDASTFKSLKTWLKDNGVQNETYYVISNDDTATMYAVHYDTSAKEWKYRDASYYYYWTVDKARSSSSVPDGLYGNSGTPLNGKTLSGVIYKSSTAPTSYSSHKRPSALTEYWSRLDYLFKAVMTATETLKTIDPGAAVHLTTFNKASFNNGWLVKSTDTTTTETTIYNSNLSEVTPNGGTRQDEGLYTSRTGENCTAVSSTGDGPGDKEGVGTSSPFYDKSHKSFAILVTDGAPNGTEWGNANKGIIQQADKLKAVTNANGDPLTLMTLGLSLNFVGGDNRTGLANASSDSSKYAKEANNGGQIVTAIKELVQSMVTKADMFGTTSDTLDPAFYPVKSDGTPIAEGYYGMDGKPYTPTANDTTPYYRWTKNGEVWTITYYNQTFKWPKRDENGNITTNGWKQSFYVKSKENFLGGNTIETNGNTTFTATHTILLDDNGNERASTKKEIKDSKNKSKPIEKSDVPSPHVNVKQLTLDQNDTNWKVYIETQGVTPLDQIKKLYENVQVKKVVSNDANEMITDNKYMLFEPGQGGDAKTFKLSSITNLDANSINWNSLTSNGTVDVPYTLYGHTPGVIRLTLTKDGDMSNYSSHATGSSLIDTEEYVLTAQYIPYSVEEMQKKDSDGGTYHTTPTKPDTEEKTAGTVQMDGRPSENTHTIDLFVRGLSLTKTDENFANGLPGAEFTLYRPATDTEYYSTAKTERKEFDGGKYIVDEVLTVDDSGVAYKNGVKAYYSTLTAASNTKYYLVETKAPQGYQQLENPLKFELTITNESTIVQGTTDLQNKEQKAKLTLIGSSDDVIRTTGSYDPENKSTDLTNEEVTATSDYKVMYYRIKNLVNKIDIVIHKVDEKKTALSGASFKLMKGSQIVPVASSGDGVVIEPKVSDQTVMITENVFTVPAGGITIKNLESSGDEYSIVEVSAPDGYVISDNTPVKFKVTSGQVVDRVLAEGVDYEEADKDFIIPNTPGVALPNTGGSGTTAIYLAGILLTGLAGVGLVMRRRRRKRS